MHTDLAHARSEVEQAGKLAQEHQAARALLQGRLDEATAQATQQTQRYTDLQVAHARLTGELEALRQRLDEQARIIDRLTPAGSSTPGKEERGHTQ